MIKLLYIVNARIPTEKAHGIQIMNMCAAFVRAGIDVELVVPARHMDADPFAFYGLKDRFPIRRLPILPVYEWGYAGFILGSLSFAFSSLLYAWKHAGDRIVYTRDQDQFSFFTIPWIRRPYIVEVHGPKDNTFFHRMLFRSARAVVATNRYIEEKLVKNFPWLLGLTMVAPNGVDVDAFDKAERALARDSLGLSHNKKIVVYAGHLYAWKGAGTLVDAAKHFGEGALLYMVGGTKEDIDHMQKTHSPGRSVVFVGHRPHEQMPLWYAAADLLVLTGTATSTDSVYFTSPVKLFEYMAARRPVVAVDSPSIRDIAGERELFFYRPDEPEDLARVVDRVLTDLPEASRRAEHARVLAESFSLTKRVSAIMGFIEKHTSA